MTELNVSIRGFAQGVGFVQEVAGSLSLVSSVFPPLGVKV